MPNRKLRRTPLLPALLADLAGDQVRIDLVEPQGAADLLGQAGLAELMGRPVDRHAHAQAFVTPGPGIQAPACSTLPARGQRRRPR